MTTCLIVHGQFLKGGFYTWVKVPDGINTKQMLPMAVTELVAYVRVQLFMRMDKGTSYMPCLIVILLLNLFAKVFVGYQ